MDITVKRNIVDKLHALSAANALMQMDHARLLAKQEASQDNIGDIISKFTTIITVKETKIAQLQSELATKIDMPATNKIPVKSTLNYAEITKDPNRARPRNKSNNRSVAARSRSRINKRISILAEKRVSTPEKAYIFTPSEDFPALEAKKEVWNLVTKATRTPKIKSVTARNGNIILKPQDRESADILRSIANKHNIIKEDSARWPRVSIDQIDATLTSAEVTEQILDQNQDIFENVTHADIKPVFKRGPRTSPLTKWICEINPVLYPTFVKSNIYLGFNRCRVTRFEEITQCFKCLRHGHLANKCFEANQTCAHCSKSGHTGKECPSLASEPKCANCRGKHSAIDRSCSARTSALANLLQRTNYGDSANDQSMDLQ